MRQRLYTHAAPIVLVELVAACVLFVAVGATLEYYKRSYFAFLTFCESQKTHARLALSNIFPPAVVEKLVAFKDVEPDAVFVSVIFCDMSAGRAVSR